MRKAIVLAVTGLLSGRSAPALAAPPPVIIEGDSVCPTPAEVAGRVASLLVGDGHAAPPSAARVDRAGSELRVRLADERGAAVAQRTLPATGTCAEMADVVAVAITTWLTQLRPESLPAPRLPSIAVAPSRRTSVAFDLGAGAGASLGEGGAAIAGAVLLSLHAGASGPGVLVRASGTSGRDVTIGARTAAWRRFTLDVGPSYQFAVGRWRVGGSVGFSAGWLSAEGQDFPVNQSSSRFSPGVAGLIRLGRSLGAVFPWLAVGTAVGIYDQPLTVVGSTDRRALHPITVDALLGISLGRFP